MRHSRFLLGAAHDVCLSSVSYAINISLDQQVTGSLPASDRKWPAISPYASVF